jgi:hypothetical protein
LTAELMLIGDRTCLAQRLHAAEQEAQAAKQQRYMALCELSFLKDQLRKASIDIQRLETRVKGLEARAMMGHGAHISEASRTSEWSQYDGAADPSQLPSAASTPLPHMAAAHESGVTLSSHPLSKRPPWWLRAIQGMRMLAKWRLA